MATRTMAQMARARRTSIRVKAREERNPKSESPGGRPPNPKQFPNPKFKLEELATGDSETLAFPGPLKIENWELEIFIVETH
jgi:hypothetical protein